MEPLGAISEREWNSSSGMYSTEEADFMAQLLNNCSLPNDLSGSSTFAAPSTFWPGHETSISLAGAEGSLMYSSDETSNNMHSFSEWSNYSGGSSVLFSSSSHENYYPSDFHQIMTANTSSSMSMDFCMEKDKNNRMPVQGFTNGLIEGDEYLNHDMRCGSMESSRCEDLPVTVLFGKNLQLKRESEVPIPEPPPEDASNITSEKSKKRSRASGDVQKKSNVKSKKNQKLAAKSNNEEDNIGGRDRQSSGSDCSEEESNASQELNGGVPSTSGSKGAAALNLSGKSRASRGSATDPQSLYARKRRERINERLKILQSLVPNGTKVDISTMLEEAVQYVKFLQLQIKLLSSDDLWMYAPIAYNGMDIGLNLKIGIPR